MKLTTVRRVVVLCLYSALLTPVIDAAINVMFLPH